LLISYSTFDIFQTLFASLRMKHVLMPMNKRGEGIDEIPLGWTGEEDSATFWYHDGWNEVPYSKSKNRR